MNHWKTIKLAFAAISIGSALFVFAGCSQIRLPQIDPTGNRIFLPAPNRTTILTPNSVRNNAPLFGPSAPNPAFARPLDPPSCCGNPNSTTAKRLHLIPRAKVYPSRANRGEIVMTPSRIVAPVGSEVVVTAGLCGGDSFFVVNQSLQWLLSADSVGQIIEVDHPARYSLDRLIPPGTKKVDGNFAWGRTGLKNRLLTRGTPTALDDIELQKGQTYVSLSSESEGTSYLTCVAPNAHGWDKRRKSTIVHWIDASWAIPVPKSATAGTVTPLTTLIRRHSDNSGVEGWKVRYRIVGGAPAEFAPTGSQFSESTTGADGQATVQLRQIAGQLAPGTTQIRVDVVRPRLFGEPEIVVESGITTVTWSAPALAITAVGPKTAGLNEPFTYQIQVTNPGDQLSRDVVLQTKDFPDSIEFISSTPKPTVFGRQLQWQLGNVAPGEAPKIVEIQLRSNTRGNNELCFELVSPTDQLTTEACAQTDITIPCIGLKIDGPDAAQVGEQAKFDLTVRNQCEEPLRNVRLQIQYGDGLRATGLDSPISLDLGDLAPNQQKTTPVVFDVISAGRHCYELNVIAENGEAARALDCLVASPSSASIIGLQLQGQRRVDRGDDVQIRATVTNNGNVPLENLNLNNRFSTDSLRAIRVTDNIPYEWIGDELLFQLGNLQPGQSTAVDVVFTALTEDGNAFSEITVSSPDLSPVTQRFDLRVEIPGAVGDAAPESDGGAVPPDNQTNEDPIGIPDDELSERLNARRNLDVSARNTNNSIAVGENAVFEFTITNSSQIPDRNVAMAVLLPTSLRLNAVLDDSGNAYPVIQQSADGTRFQLEPRREMRPGDDFVFTIVAEALQPGQATVELQVASDNSAGTIATNDTVAVSR